MQKACFCYTVDSNYMGATVLSALQARRNLSPERGDVFIVLIDADAAKASRFAAICAGYGILFRHVTPAEADGVPVYCARHLLDRFLPPDYTEIVHLDGDTQILGPLDDLLDIPLPGGRVLAVRDPMTVMIHHPSRVWQERRRYLLSIGIPEERLDRYFNSGVFRVHRSDAGRMGRESLRLLRTVGTGYRFTDQDAFNVAFGDVVDLVSFRWNFPVFFLNGGFEISIAPTIMHFMSNPRPWQGAFMPWGATGHRIYTDFAAAHPELASGLRPLTGVRAFKYGAQQRAKHLVERHAWTRRPVRERVAHFEREALS